LDLPASGADPVPLQHLAVASDPWPGAVAIWRSADGESFELHSLAEVPAVIGRTHSAFPAGPVWTFDLDHVNRALAARGGAPIDGAVGGDVLRPAEAVIDYARATLYLRADGRRAE
jgi:hypothetical protein